MTWAQREADAMDASFLRHATEKGYRQALGIVQATAKDRIQTLLARTSRLQTDLAFVVSQRAAFESLLGKVFPQHDVLKDPSLRERIGNAGITAWNAAEDWDVVKNAGRTFNVPAPDLEQGWDYATLRKHYQTASYSFTVEKRRADTLEQQLAAAQRTIDGLIRDVTHHMAQSRAFRTHLAKADPNNPLIRDASMRRRVADQAYEALRQTNFRDWDVVKQIGDSFLSSYEAERSRATVDGAVAHE